jgi:Protein of unknown function (DUF3306)
MIVLDIGIAQQRLRCDSSVARDCAIFSTDAAVAVVEVKMHKLISVLSLAPTLIFSQSIDAQAFELASLPPIESITATTDVRPFLAPGVPREVKVTALRRAWVMDPRIRDFRGLQENDWDFGDPSGIPGFGPLEPSENKTLAARVFAETVGEIATGRPR